MPLSAYPYPMPTRTHTIWKYEKEQSKDSSEEKTALLNKLRDLVNTTFEDFETHNDPFNSFDYKNPHTAILKLITELDK